MDLKGRRVVLRKPGITITEENFRVLQLLDFLSNVTQYADEDIEDVARRVKEYMKKEGIDRENVDKYVVEYPDRIYKNMYEMRIF